MLLLFMFSDPPFVSTEEDSMIVNITDSVSITCTVYGIPIPSITWTYTDTIIYDGKIIVRADPGFLFFAFVF